MEKPVGKTVSPLAMSLHHLDFMQCFMTLMKSENDSVCVNRLGCQLNLGIYQKEGGNE